jgi:hypothetical protein
MAYNIDILITYAEKDNQTIKQGELGWVTQFKRFIEPMLLQVLGNKPNIVLKSEFEAPPALDDVAILITVLTKDFGKSTKCRDLVDAFDKKNSQSKINRIFKVIKSPLSQQEQPPALRDLLEYDLYQMGGETGTSQEYVDFFSPEAEKHYWMKMVDLAHDIHEAWLALKEGDSIFKIKNIYPRKTIYLAETSHDLSVQRSIIRRELLRNGFVVLPDHALPSRATDVERDVRKDLEQCALSIHLIGSAYGEIPEGGERSVVDMQNRIAAEVASTKKQLKQEFSRLIWVVQNLKNASDKQKSFVEALKRDTEAQDSAEILQNPLEDFKNIIRQEVIDVNDVNAEEIDSKTIYLMHDKVDAAEVEPFQKTIEKCGFKVLSPAFDGDLLDVRKRHIENLRILDGVIIFKGKVNDQWVRMKVLDLLKAPGFGRKKPIRGRAIVGTGNFDSYKDQNFKVIYNDSERSTEILKDFLSEI